MRQMSKHVIDKDKVKKAMKRQKPWTIYSGRSNNNKSG